MNNRTDIDELCDADRAKKAHVPEAEDLPTKKEWIFIGVFVVVCFVAVSWFYNKFLN